MELSRAQKACAYRHQCLYGILCENGLSVNKRATEEVVGQSCRGNSRPPIVLELLQGCRSVKERRTLREHLEGLHWLVTEDQHWFQAGEMANDLRQKGVTVSAMDALIATLAQTYSCQLMHLDQDYEHIAKHTDLSLFQIIHS